MIAPYEKDPRTNGGHGPSDELVAEMKEKARAAGVLTPHIFPDGGHLTQLETAHVLRMSGLSPLGPIAVNTMAPDEGNMYLLGKVGSSGHGVPFRHCSRSEETHGFSGGVGVGGSNPLVPTSFSET